MKKKAAFTISTPEFLPKMSEQCSACFLESKEDFLYHLFRFLVAYNVRVGDWNPYYDKDKEDFEKFRKEYRWNWSMVQGEYKSPGWYIFQHYTTEDRYYSDKYEDEVRREEDRVIVDSLDSVKSRFESFLSKFKRNFYEIPGSLQANFLE